MMMLRRSKVQRTARWKEEAAIQTEQLQQQKKSGRLKEARRLRAGIGQSLIEGPRAKRNITTTMGGGTADQTVLRRGNKSTIPI